MLDRIYTPKAEEFLTGVIVVAWGSVAIGAAIQGVAWLALGAGFFAGALLAYEITYRIYDKEIKEILRVLRNTERQKPLYRLIYSAEDIKRLEEKKGAR